MRPFAHLAVSPLVGTVVYAVSGSWQAGFCAGTATVLMDIDHVIDFLFFSPRPLNLPRFLLAPDSTTTWTRLVYILHSYELMVMMTVISCLAHHVSIWGVTAGMWVHLIMDECGNRQQSKPLTIPALFYFFLYRAKYSFVRSSISRPREPG